jgi:dinuclear metal center YbgI/SA1388 family protein
MPTGHAVPLASIAAYLDDFLRIREVPDEENAVNGLEAENASGEVTRIVAAVDASLETIEGVIGRKDGKTEGRSALSSEGPGGRPGPGSPDHPLLLVHHGLFWDGNVPLTGRRYRRVRALLDQDIALYAAHIPLDVHPEVGNNHVLARQIGLGGIEPFDSYRGIPIGVRGVLDYETPREALVARVEQLLGAAAKLIPGGPALSLRVGIITGGAGGRIAAAREAGLDTYLTGEGAHHTFFDAMELGVNAIFAGHYATETVGVKALAEHLSRKFAVPWEFHDHPTGL